MIDVTIIPLQEHFSALDDPRAQHSIDHLLLDIVLITICAVICGAVLKDSLKGITSFRALV
jgi:Na+/citrate or Na+/malate symporter